MYYEGPIYRPPSEADSLLVQATVGCPHNRCTFCMIYKDGPRFRIRKIADIKKDILEGWEIYGNTVRSLFFPAGNTIIMKTADLCEICRFSREVFPELERITVYGSSQYIHKKGLQNLKQLAEAGLSRIHMGLESGDDEVLRRICKGTHSSEQIEAGKWVMEAGIELSLYVILGIGGAELSRSHALKTAEVLNRIEPDFIRLRTLVPKINTPLLEEMKAGKFNVLGPYDILRETALLIENLSARSRLASDHYSNYLNLYGNLPDDRPRLLQLIESALRQPESVFRPFFIGDV